MPASAGLSAEIRRSPSGGGSSRLVGFVGAATVEDNLALKLQTVVPEPHVGAHQSYAVPAILRVKKLLILLHLFSGRSFRSLERSGHSYSFLRVYRSKVDGLIVCLVKLLLMIYSCVESLTPAVTNLYFPTKTFWFIQEFMMLPNLEPFF